MMVRLPLLFCLLTGCFTATGSLPEPENHRPEAAPMCDNERDSPVIVDPMTISAGCTAHDQCTDGINGRCTDYGRGYADCTYDQCFEDSDCGAGPCVCGTGAGNNVCMGGDCQVDADCGEDGYCSPSYSDCGDYSGVVAYYCHTAADECTDDTDCPGAGPGGAYCMHSAELGHWVCSTSHCVG